MFVIFQLNIIFTTINRSFSGFCLKSLFTIEFELIIYEIS